MKHTITITTIEALLINKALGMNMQNEVDNDMARLLKDKINNVVEFDLENQRPQARHLEYADMPNIQRNGSRVMSEWEKDHELIKAYNDGFEKGRADKEAEIKPLLKAIKFVLEDYSIRLGDYAKVIDEKLKENRND